MIAMTAHQQPISVSYQRSMNALYAKVKYPSTIDYSIMSNTYQPELTDGGARWLLYYEAKNAFGGVLPYRENCEIHDNRAKIVFISGR